MTSWRLLPALVLIPLLAGWPIGWLAAQDRPRSGPNTADSVRGLVDQGRRSEALDLARRAVRDRPAEPPARAALAIAAMAVEDWDLAVESADRLLERGRDLSAWQLVYGQAYLSHARASPSLGAISKVKKGRAAVERAIALDPDNLDARLTLLQFLVQAPKIAGGSREEARRQAQEIARRDPARGLLAWLEVAATDEDPEELRPLYAGAVGLLRSLPDTSTEPMGSLMAVAGGLQDDELREELVDRLYTAFPSHPVAAYHRARLWIIDKERPAEAERLLLRYLSGPERRGGNASRAGAHWRLAQLYARQDRDAHAKEQYRLAAVLDPRLRSSRIPPGLEARL